MLGVIMELECENLDWGMGPGGLCLTPEYVGFLRSQGYRVDGVRDVQVVESSGGQRLYVVCEVFTYEYPESHPDLDVAAHRGLQGVCSCGDFTHRKGADVSVEGVTPFESGACKHLGSVEFGGGAVATAEGD